MYLWHFAADNTLIGSIHLPTRILRPGINDSRAINSLSDSGEIFYRRLMSIVDDFGRTEAAVELLRPELFKRQLDRWPAERVEAALTECAQTTTEEGEALVSVYYSGARLYLQINNFGQRVRKDQRSKYPEPESTRGKFPRVPAISRLGVVGGVVVVGVEGGGVHTAPAARRPPAPVLMPKRAEQAVAVGQTYPPSQPEPQSPPPPDRKPTNAEPQMPRGAPEELFRVLSARAMDGEAIRRLWYDCRTIKPDVTPDEILGIVDRGQSRWLSKSTRNPVGLILKVVPEELAAALPPPA